MKKGPGLLSSFGKKSKEPLTKDYRLDQKFSISTASVAGVALRSTATNKDGVSTVDVGAVFKSKNTSIGVKIDEQSTISLTFVLKKIVPLTNFVASFNLRDFESGKIATTLTFTEIAPSTNAIASFQLPNFRSGKLKVQYFHHHATLASTLALNQAPCINVSATIGTPTFAMGAKAAYETTSTKLINFAVGINFNRPDSTASLVLCDNGDTIRAFYGHRFDVSKKTATAVGITRRLSTNETDVVVGGCYVFDDQTLVKARLDNCGKLGAVWQHRLIRRSLVSLSSELDTKALHKTPKFGLALVLKP
ncbi:hypothetical protein L1987_24470 [Smallanthus sonchifolius]|uniref:Uncharacterized protein n=1 Tax=Smallanthus sonchifolius TaxID=185202 RepID=A0ACB9IKQ6_9ASTR|nr:hypothetical protein L1987_24470 [Smallanthus sonchifolius]